MQVGTEQVGSQGGIGFSPTDCREDRFRIKK